MKKILFVESGMFFLRELKMNCLWSIWEREGEVVGYCIYIEFFSYINCGVCLVEKVVVFVGICNEYGCLYIVDNKK